MYIIYVIAGFLSGIISGMGIGGGTILIPALTLILELPQQQAQSINLIFFIPTAIVASYKHKKEGNIDFSNTKAIIFYGVIGALIGSFIAVNLDGEFLKKIFGFFLLIMGVLEIYKIREKKQ